MNLDMPPSVFGDDVHNRLPTDVIPRSEPPVGHPSVSVLTPDFRDNFSSQFRIPIFTSSLNAMRKASCPVPISTSNGWKMSVLRPASRPCGSSSFSFAVSHVIERGAQPEVIRINTRGVVAFVADKHSGRNWSFREHVSVSARSKGFAEEHYAPIPTVSNHSSPPDKTSATAFCQRPEFRFVDGPKSGRDRSVEVIKILASSIHSLSMIVVSSCRSRKTGGSYGPEIQPSAWGSI